MLKPGANLEMLSADEEEEEETAPKLQLLDDQQESSIESSRSVTPDVWVPLSSQDQETTKISGLYADFVASHAINLFVFAARVSLSEKDFAAYFASQSCKAIAGSKSECQSFGAEISTALSDDLLSDQILWCVTISSSTLSSVNCWKVYYVKLD